MFDKMTTFGPSEISRTPIATNDSASVFWGEITPCEHLVHIYEQEAAFLDSLEGFVTGGINNREAVIVIATPAHREGLENRMEARGVEVEEARASDRYIPLDAQETLSKFMTTLQGKPWPDEARFERLVDDLIRRAGGAHRRRIRAFGEMVAILWSRGDFGATIRLERLWHDLCQKKSFCLFCAYPRIGFKDDADHSIKEIIAAHSRCWPT